MTGPHTPTRPQWGCAGCAQEWPCESARRRLLATFQGAPVSLSLLLAARLAAAAEDLRQEPAGLLHRRFVGWVREPKPWG
jgi:hypothetical protein